VSSLASSSSVYTSHLHPDLLRGRLVVHFVATHGLVLDTNLLVLAVVPVALQTLHLPRLQRAKVLLLDVDLARLVAHTVGIDVLLRPRLGALWLLERRLHHVCVGELFAAEAKVHPGAHFLDFDARQFLAGALGAQEVEAELYLWVGEFVGGFLRGYADEVLEALDVDFGCVLALEEVDEEALCEGVFGLIGVLEDGAVEGHHGLETNGGLLVLELLERAEGVGVDVELEHVEDLVGEGARKGHAVRALLGVEGEHDEGGFVLEGEEFEG
jgi:hypothetical protein